MSKPITECVECSHYLVSGTATAFAKELDINDYFYCTYKIDSLKDDKIHANQAEKFEKDLKDAGIKAEKLSPQILPDYRRKDM